MKQILFISHDASRSGAPRVLYLYLKWLRQYHPEIARHLLMLRDGDLADDFRSIASLMATMSLDGDPGIWSAVKNRFFRLGNSSRLGSPIPDEIASFAARGAYPLVYANTTAALEYGVRICDISPGRPLLLLHVHELDTMIDMVQPRFNELAARVDRFIAVSQMVKDCLVKQRGIPDEKVSVVYEFSEVMQRTDAATQERESFAVCSAGTVEYRKGFDLFIQAARYVKELQPDARIRFTWVGKISAELRAFVQSDLKKSGLEEMVQYTGEVKDAAARIGMADVFMLPSREDPFPLVCIEAGMLGKPILCFEQATGISEVLADGGGKTVPYGDARAMAGAILHYYRNRDELQADGLRGRELFSAFTPESRCPEIFSMCGNDSSNATFKI
jgi:glycosyltransferase involved in cell wall biosynthesis